MECLWESANTSRVGLGGHWGALVGVGESVLGGVSKGGWLVDGGHGGAVWGSCMCGGRDGWGGNLGVMVECGMGEAWL